MKTILTTQEIMEDDEPIDEESVNRLIMESTNENEV